MKTLLSFCTCLCLYYCTYAQVTYNPYIEKKFKEACKQELSQQQRTELEQLQASTAKNTVSSRYTGFAFFSQFETDTMNKKEWRNFNRPKTILLDTGRGTMEVPDAPGYHAGNSLLHTPVPLNAWQHGDSLLISFGAFYPPFLFHLICKGKQTAFFYAEGPKDGMQLTLNGEKKTLLEVPVKVKSFILSSADTQGGEYIYGRAEIESALWYQDEETFFKGYLAARLRAVYYFTFKASQVQTLPLHSSSLYSMADQK